MPSRMRIGRVLKLAAMPAFAYRWIYMAHSLRSLERNILKFCGIKPVRESVIGMVHDARESTQAQWFADMRSHGARAE